MIFIKKSIWQNPSNNSFNTNKGKSKIWGSIMQYGIEIRFSLNLQTNLTRQYRYRGQIELIGTDNHLMQNHKKPNCNNKQNTSKSYYLQRSLYMNNSNENDIKAKIEIAADKLFFDNFKFVRNIIDNNPTIRLTFIAAVTYFTKEFLNHNVKKVSKKTYQEKLKALESVGAFIGLVDLSNIRQSNIKISAKKLGKSARNKLRIAEQFWNYCREKGRCNGENPFTIYFTEVREEKNPRSLQRAALNLNRISTEAEKQLDMLIQQHFLKDAFYLGLSLIKDGGFTAVEACKLKWEDVNFSAGFLVINFYKNENVGATHNYSRVITPFLSDLITKKYNGLLIGFSKNEIDKTYILQKGKECCTAKALTAFARQVLKNCCNVETEILQNNSSHSCGGGVQLLLRTYQYKLNYICGLRDSGEKKYLCGKSLRGSTTDDNYCNYASKESRTHAYKVLKRLAPCTADLKTKIGIKQEQLPDGRIKITISPSDPQHIVQCRFNLLLNAGDVVSATAESGITGEIRKSRD